MSISVFYTICHKKSPPFQFSIFLLPPKFFSGGPVNGVDAPGVVARAFGCERET